MAMTRDDLVRRVSLGGVIVATAVISYTILRDRAVNIGFTDWWTAWLYPVGLDALILGASRVWGQKDISPGTRRFAKVLTLSAIGAGIAAFVVEFLPKGWVAVAFACLIPASLASALLLTSRVAADKRDGYTQPDPDPVSEDDEDTDDDVQTIHADALSAPNTEVTADIPTLLRDGDNTAFLAEHFVVTDAQKTEHVPDLVAAEQPVQAGRYVPLLSPEDMYREDLARAARGDAPRPVPEESINEQTMVIPVVSATGPRIDAQQPSSGPPEQSSRSVSNNRRNETVSADVRKSWVRDRLEQGIETTGADVDKQFPQGSRNGARIVRQVREAMAKEAKE